jgi:hypothetical protein
MIQFLGWKDGRSEETDQPDPARNGNGLQLLPAMVGATVPLNSRRYDAPVRQPEGVSRFSRMFPTNALREQPRECLRLLGKLSSVALSKPFQIL